MHVNLSIISPNFSPEFIKIYEKANSIDSSSDHTFKLEKINENVFFTLLHNSIELITGINCMHKVLKLKVILVLI